MGKAASYFDLNHKRHVLFAGQLYSLALPQGIVYCEGVYRNGQMLCVHLWEAFATWVISENWEKSLNDRLKLGIHVKIQQFLVKLQLNSSIGIVHELAASLITE